jgi:phosphoserine phosphatase
MTEMRRIALVDFDGTLISIDSLVYMCKRERMYFSPGFLLGGARIVLAKNPASRLAARSAFKRRMLARLRRLTDAKIESYAEYFARQKMSHVLEHIARERYDEIVVVSASERHVIEKTLARVPDIAVTAVIANDWDNLDNFVTCWGEEKVRRVREMFGDAAAEYTAYTDSMHDAPLIAFANMAFLVSESAVTATKDRA